MDAKLSAAQLMELENKHGAHNYHLFLWYWIREKVCLYGMWKERNIMISFPLIRQ